ncbi:hypothetical protein [Salinactinospora qingdaonensis]|uniref:Solute:sodium symporter small subunit n=1 Tax=Salinactinospora qingdaonensis TaxID=702744 RepID=A0ABP7GHU5_9ACTN
MSPQTRLAHARGWGRGRWRVPRLNTGETERAAVLYRRQRRQGLLALVALLGLVFGLPLVFAVWPELDHIRLAGLPLSWGMLAVLPYPAMVALAYWQLRRAERAEER